MESGMSKSALGRQAGMRWCMHSGRRQHIRARSKKAGDDCKSKLKVRCQGNPRSQPTSTGGCNSTLPPAELLLNCAVPTLFTCRAPCTPNLNRHKYNTKSTAKTIGAARASLMAFNSLLKSFPRTKLRLPRARFSSSSAHLSPRNTACGQPHFPCVDAHAVRASRIIASASQRRSAEYNPGNGQSDTGPEPPYARPTPASYHTYHHPQPLSLSYTTTPLPSFDLAYETWGTLSPAKDNVILLHTGLSASSHAASTSLNPAPGWWEKFIGPGKALDTNKFFIICTNVLGGCYGSTGPSSIEPETEKPWGTRFPVISIFDMVQAQFVLLDSLGINKLYASVGCSMGGMQSLAAGWLYPSRVGKIVSISGTARSAPSSIAMRYAQRSVLMADPNWNNGFYYDGLPPHTGMKLARQIATITYRSGPEWDQRFGRQLRETSESITQKLGPDRMPALCPDFLIETYLDHQGEQFCLKYDANSLIYISKAMDLFDMSYPALEALQIKPMPEYSRNTSSTEQVHKTSHSKSHPPPLNPPSHLPDLAAGMAPLKDIPTLVLGVQSDILFTVEQQREIADALRMAGNENVSYYELGGVWGHDTFLLDVLNVGSAIRGFLSIAP